MANQIDEIKRKIQERRRKRLSQNIISREHPEPQFFSSHVEAREEPNFYFENDSETNQEVEQKLFRKDMFIMQVLLSICLFLVVGIMFKVQSPKFEAARSFVQSSFEQEFQFASIANWYENQFGKPLALLPATTDVALDNIDPSPSNYVYAMPAGGRVTQGFEHDSKGVIIETSNSEIEAAKAGMVRFVSEEQTLGKTVIIAHYSGGESWYAMLDQVDVEIYDHIEVGQKIGTATKNEGDDNGIFYFAIKEGETFINPIEVIAFE